MLNRFETVSSRSGFFTEPAGSAVPPAPLDAAMFHRPVVAVAEALDQARVGQEMRASVLIVQGLT